MAGRRGLGSHPIMSRVVYSDRFPLCVVMDAVSKMAICKSGFEHKDLVKQSGFRWVPELKSWTMPLDFFLKNIGPIGGRLGLCEQTVWEIQTGNEYRPPKVDRNFLLNTALKNLKMKPYQYQIDGINFALENPYTIIGDEQGLGKTPQGIGVLAAFERPSIVVCPAFLKLNWKSEIEKFWGAPTFVIDGNTTPKKIAPYLQDAAAGKPVVFVINYEIMGKHEGLFQLCHHWVVDESQALKTPTAQRTERFWNLIRRFNPLTLTFLTGTAITNSVADFYTLLNFCGMSYKENGVRVDDCVDYSSPLRFAEYFTHPRITKFGTKYMGLKHWPELRRLMEHKYLRRSAADHLPDLPPLTRSRFTCNPDPKLLKECDAGLKSAWERMKGMDQVDGAELTQAAISSAKRGAATLKATHTAELAKSIIEAGEKVIIFSDHTEPVQIIAEALGSVARAITGATAMQARQRFVDDFQAPGGEAKALVATYGALATGVTLTAARHTLANDLPWVPSTYLQAEKRFHRIGQKGHCQVRIAVAPGMDTMITRTILEKAMALTAVLSYGREQHLDF